MADVAASLREAAADPGSPGLIASGRPMAAAAELNPGGRVMLTGRLNCLLSFDPTSGIATCEAGVTFGELDAVFMPHGFGAPVPGAPPTTTIGGAAAADLSDPSSACHGRMGDRVLWVDVALPTGEIIRASRDANQDVFRATIGGLGLTGVIVRAGFQLVARAGGAVKTSSAKELEATGRMTNETWLVLGASSSIARAFAQVAAARGHRVILTGRDRAHLEACAADIAIRYGIAAPVIAFDATALDSHASFIGACRNEAVGTLNIFLAIASVPDDAEGAPDFSSAQRTVMTTYVAPVSLLWHLTPVLAAQRRGRVIILGSIAGERGRDENYIYASAKAGLHIFAQGLRARLRASGVAVTTVKLGFVDTSRTWGRVPASLSASPTTTAVACLAAVERAGSVVYIPGVWHWVAVALRLMPAALVAMLATRRKNQSFD